MQNGTSIRRGSSVIQTMLARLAAEEEEYKRQMAGNAAGESAAPKASAARG
jgi:hypothetical protein